MDREQKKYLIAPLTFLGEGLPGVDGSMTINFNYSGLISINDFENCNSIEELKKSIIEHINIAAQYLDAKITDALNQVEYGIK